MVNGRSNDIIRINKTAVSRKNSQSNINPVVQYNGGYKSYEDPADYVRTPVKAVRLA